MVVCSAFAQDTPSGRPRLQAPPQEAAPDVVHAHREAIVKDDYKRNLEDAAMLARLAGELKSELENGDQNVVSIKTMKKADEIGKLARSIHSRLKRY